MLLNEWNNFCKIGYWNILQRKWSIYFAARHAGSSSLVLMESVLFLHNKYLPNAARELGAFHSIVGWLCVKYVIYFVIYIKITVEIDYWIEKKLPIILKVSI